MPKLNCCVNNCAHNAESCCSLGQIQVDGSAANSSAETCCNNFAEQTGASNCSCTPNPSLKVDCKATDCTHNKECECCADSIDVAGSGACNCQDTQCSSFCPC